jgi:hypothetical protein
MAKLGSEVIEAGDFQRLVELKDLEEKSRKEKGILIGKTIAMAD